uniref:Uncharacterized protein n=1 Tax=Avena sativa TaxID=4498 RepID=A0ACD5TLQ2_AVESA
MAEIVVSMTIGPLVSMLRDKASSYLLDQYNVMEGMEEQHKTLKRKLPAILDVITDAEEQATAHREGAKAWLQELKTVAYEANKVFDEFKYEALRREARKNGHYRKLGFDGIKLFPTHNRIVFRYKMGRKLCWILQAVEVLVEEMHAFRFKYRPPPPVSKQWRQTDYVIIDPQEIAGRSRENEKKEIVDILLGRASKEDLAVVPIVGMGGLGKTTLAQLIYNEPQIQKHFQFQLWVCVSDTFDVNSLAKSIVEASPKKNEDEDKPPLDRLKKLVSGQMYLLVLDDVWNREVHKWEQLKVCLQHGGTGSVVLTTTRDNRVAELMGTDKLYHLKNLEDRFLKEIIEVKAFGLQKRKPAKLVEMVGEIAERCSGSPLAATALGSVLRMKTSVKEWKAVLSRSSICTEETGILPILKLSYNDLPSHMKQCFAFCAIFPKDYKIDVDKLIELWIANGFIPEHKEDSLETIGKQIFSELASRSFFLDKEESEDYEYYSTSTCKIHDLMHDIAMSVMEKECVVVTVEPSQPEWLPDTARHLFFSYGDIVGLLNDSMEKRSPAIQTLLCDQSVRSPLQHVSKYSSLHALKLCTVTESFPLKPKYLHHLRYLDLSNSNIKALPEDISILYNLQMLDLSYCSDLHQLPRQMKYMTSLRHLYTHECQKLKSMPPELGKLTKLQTLTCFVAAHSGPDCSDVAELEHLNLGGKLELCQVENIDIEAEAKLANLGNKNDLKELRLRWTSVCHSEVLNNFEPHDGLEVLRIYSYGGKGMGMLQNMVVIHLFHCESLQVLFRCGTSSTFPKLKQLVLEHLLDFERWWEINERPEGQIIFPVLEKMFIKYCGKLVALPEALLLEQPCNGGYRSAFPALKVLEMAKLENFQKWDTALQGEMLFPQLEKLSIQKCPKLVALPEAPLLEQPCNGGYRSAFPALKVLKMAKLENFQKWDGAAGREEILFPQLEKLSIEKCPKLIALPKASFLEHSCNGGYLSAFPALRVLEMEELENFQKWHAALQGEEILFPQLQKLLIQKCPKLISLPKAPKLSVLEIKDGRQEIFHWVDRYLSSLTVLTLKLQNIETTSRTECASVLPVDSREKWYQKSPLTVLELGCCNSFFGSGGLEPWDYFLHLVVSTIYRCEVLVHWPEKVFQSLVSLKGLEIKCCNTLTGYAQALVQPSISERSQHLPALESLSLAQCTSLVEMFNVPASLKSMSILQCSKLESIFGKQQLGTSELVQGSSCSEAIVPTAVSQLSSSPMNHFCPCLEYLLLMTCDSLSAVLHLPPSLKTMYIRYCSSIQVLSCQLDPSAGEHSLPPCLTRLDVRSCASMLRSILRLPTSLKELIIEDNSGLTSLEPVSGQPLSLESLWLYGCTALASLPNEPQIYRSLKLLQIKDCPAIKKLPRCLQQRLGNIQYKYLDAQYEVMASKPKRTDALAGVVRDWSMYAERRDEVMRHANRTTGEQEAE